MRQLQKLDQARCAGARILRGERIAAGYGGRNWRRCAALKTRRDL